MRASLWLAGLSAATSLACAVAAAGCSSSSTTTPPTGQDASLEASPGDDAQADSGSPLCFVDASLTVFAASDASAAGCAACVQTNCQDAISACATDCTCISLFTCLADSGVATTGLGPAATAAATECAGSSGLTLLNNPGVMGLVNCLSGVCLEACNVSDGGPDAGLPDAALSEAGAGEAGTDAGAIGDAADVG
jgi:hypothetical protein